MLNERIFPNFARSTPADWKRLSFVERIRARGCPCVLTASDLISLRQSEAPSHDPDLAYRHLLTA